jgi:hypothetical protein
MEATSCDKDGIRVVEAYLVAHWETFHDVYP